MTAVMGTYGTPPLTLVRGRGARVWDDAGHEYVDLIAGIAVCALGHAHPRITAAVSKQLDTLGHVSNLFDTRPARELAERLVALAGAEAKVFFANSGAEANEAALHRPQAGLHLRHHPGLEAGHQTAQLAGR